MIEKVKEVVVRRRVDPEGKIRLWGKGIRVGRKVAGQEVWIPFNREGDHVKILVHDRRGVLLKERVLEWLTKDWLWAGLEEEASDKRGQTYI